MSVFLRWDVRDQDAALAWVAHESARCSSCGHHPDEGSGVHAHTDVCPGCAAVEAAAEATRKERDRGVHIRITSGAVADCVRCSTVAAMNKKGGGGRGR